MKTETVFDQESVDALKAITKPKGKRGGYRPGGGKPLGSKNKATIDKEMAREGLRRLVLKHLEPMARAQIENAMGIAHFFLREPGTGKFERVVDPEQILTALNAPAEAGSRYYIYTKDPSVQAWTDLMNRALDKPAEQKQAIQHTGELTIKWQGE